MLEDPFREAVDGWLLGSPKFVDRVAWMTSPRHPDAVRRASAGGLRLPGGPGGRGRALWDRRR